MDDQFKELYSDNAAMVFPEPAPSMYFNFPDRFEKAPPTWNETIEYLIENCFAPLLATGFVCDSNSALSQIKVVRYIKVLWGFYWLVEQDRGEYFDEMDSGMDLLSAYIPRAIGFDIIPPIVIADNEFKLFVEFQKQTNKLWRVNW